MTGEAREYIVALWTGGSLPLCFTHTSVTRGCSTIQRTAKTPLDSYMASSGVADCNSLFTVIPDSSGVHKLDL